MSHLCAVPDCHRPAKDGQLMCWPHWCRVPKVLNKAIFATYGRDQAAYEEHVAAAVLAIQQKEAAEASGRGIGRSVGRALKAGG
ncbi:hypothetical protein BH10PSE14_BH10PSE14_29890 [soil metagenome]